MYDGLCVILRGGCTLYVLSFLSCCRDNRPLTPGFLSSHEGDGLLRRGTVVALRRRHRPPDDGVHGLVFFYDLSHISW